MAKQSSGFIVKMTYEQYIASAEWAKKRKSRLEIDGYRCRLCDEDGSRFQLEVHHKPSAYEKIPDESIEDDLTTVCVRCHDLITASIREDRYGKRELPETVITNTIQIRQEINSHGMARSELQIDILSPADNAQRATGRPSKQMDEVDQTDFVKEEKNRRR